MPKVAIPKTREEKRQRRHLRLRNKVSGTAERPRLVVFRSLKHIYAQLVDDVGMRTILTVSDGTFEGKKSDKSTQVGKAIAERAKAAGITRVVFDRGGFLYHGRIRAVADAARKAGLEF